MKVECQSYSEQHIIEGILYPPENFEWGDFIHCEWVERHGDLGGYYHLTSKSLEQKNTTAKI